MKTLKRHFIENTKPITFTTIGLMLISAYQMLIYEKQPFVDFAIFAIGFYIAFHISVILGNLLFIAICKITKI